MSNTFGLAQSLQRENNKKTASDKIQKRCTERAINLLKAQIEPARSMITDPHTHVAGSPPRRAGKSFEGASAALITGESKPGALSLIISLTLPQIKKIYWQPAGGHIKTIAKQFDLNLEFHDTELQWRHENGSIGYLLSAENRARMEYIRGLEADIYVIDECQAFAPEALRYLVETIIEPQRSSREGRTMLIGTPGPVEAGPFWEATCEDATRETFIEEDGKQKKARLPTNVLYGETDKHGRDIEESLLWSRHHWTLEHNTYKKHQWRDALREKKAKGWADDHPTWLRERMGKWTGTSDGLVYQYLTERPTGTVTWSPEVTPENPTGLPRGDWRLIGGLDLGFEAPTAFVVAAYSQSLRQLRHICDFSKTRMLVSDIAAMIQQVQMRLGKIDIIFADAGNLGKLIIASLVQDYGLPIQRAEKQEKYDHIELLNDAFIKGEVKIIEGTTLEEQLCTVQWDLENGTEDDPSKRRVELAKLGKLKELDSIPNDSTDAFLYLYRGSLHHYGNAAPKTAEPDPWSPEWVKMWEAEQLRKARAQPENTPERRAISGRVPVPNSIKKALTPWNTSTQTFLRKSSK